METTLGIGGIVPQSIKTKPDAMKYAFDLTTQRNYSTGEVSVNIEKAMEVYKAFIENMELPDVEKSVNGELMENYSRILKSVLLKLDEYIGKDIKKSNDGGYEENLDDVDTKSKDEVFWTSETLSCNSNRKK